MSRRDEGGIRRWTISGVTAVMAVGLVVALFRVPETVRASSPRSKMSPVLMRTDAGIDVAFDEQKILSDPTPLYLPTKWNAARKPIARPDPGATFENFQSGDGGVSLAERLKISFPNALEVAGESLGESPGSMLAGIGRSDLVLPALPERPAFVEIVAEGTGRTVLRQTLADARPPAGAWQLMEFSGRVDATGLSGPLTITRRSGVESVDEYFQRYLVQTWRVGQQLAPGYYRIAVGP
jgi:hypothetical protein